MAVVATAPESGAPYTLQSAATSGNGNAVAPPHSFKYHSIYIEGTSGVGAGAVQVETSLDPNDANTWAPLTTSPTTVIAGGIAIVQVTGIIQILRARISTTVTGGTVTVNYVGAKLC